MEILPPCSTHGDSSSIDDPSSLGVTAELACRGWTLPDRIRELVSSGAGSGALAACLAADRKLASVLRRWRDSPLVRGGTDEMTRLAFLAHVRRLFLPDRRVDRYHRETLWRHSVATAAVARMIATTCGGPAPGVAFLAAAVHDVGLLASERIHGASFGNLVANVDELSAMHEIERESLGWDHAQLGGEIVRHWGLPEPIVVATRYHHAPEIAVERDLPGAEVTACVALANHLCSRTGWSSMGIHNLPAPSGPVLQMLGIDAEKLTTIWSQLPPTLRDATTLTP